MSDNSIEKTQAVNQTQIVSDSAVESTQMAVSVKCPVCGTNSPGGEIYCSECGFLLSSTPVDVEAGLPAENMPKLVDPSGGREFVLKHGVNTIGRQDTDVLLSHPTVSRRHAQIIVEESRCLLEDVGSTNGTVLNGSQLGQNESVNLSDGDEIVFGSVRLLFEYPLASGEEIAAEAEVGSAQTEEVPEGQEIEELEEVRDIETEPASIPIAARLVTRAGEVYPIKEGENRIGRRQDNDIVIADPYVSSSHAVITAADGEISITDVGSTNGTSVAGEKLAPNEPRTISIGDEIVVGQTVLTLESAEDE